MVRAGADSPSSPVDFVRDVQPILAASCVRCHGDQPQANLRLDTRDGLLKGGVSGPAVVPGNGKGSRLYERLVLADPVKRMPWLTDPLAPAQIETLRRWIDEGARWPEGMTVAAAAPAPATRPAAPASSAGPGGPRLVFNRDVRPILSDNCFTCHGPDRNRRQAGLRLDREEVAKSPLPSGNVAIVPGSAERERPDPADHEPRRAEADAPRLERQGAADHGSDRHAPSLDRGRRRMAAPLVVHPADARRPPRGPEDGLAEERRGRLHPGRDRKERPRPVGRGRARRAAAPRQPGPHRPAADAGGAQGVPRGHGRRRLRAPGRPPPRVPPVRRAPGVLLARPRAVRRQRRLPQRQRAHGLALSRLRHRRLQPEPAVRPLHDGADRRATSSRTRRRSRRSPRATTASSRRPRRAEPSPRSTAPSTWRTASGTPRRSGSARRWAAPSATTTSSIPSSRRTSTASAPSSPT